MGLSAEHTLRAMNEDRFLASTLLFKHRHPQDSPKFHITIMDLWRSSSQLVGIQAFREGGKTTLSEEFILLEALFHNFNYLLLFCETYTKACQRLESIKHELMTNQKIYGLFGKQRGSAWSENKIILPNGVCLEAHGWEEEIRGYKHLDSRPDRALLDDIESLVSVRDKASVDKGWKKIHVELLPAMDKDKGKIWIIGTPLADDCLINRAATSPDWISAKFPICNGDPDDTKSESMWPDRYPLDWIKTRKKYYESNGMLKEFNQEYMLIPSGIDGRPFQEEMLRFSDLPPRIYSPKVVIIDPARTADVKSSDQTGYVVVSRIGTKIYIHESGGKYWQPNEIIEGIFSLSHKYEDCEVAIEKTSLDNWLLQPIKTQMLRLGVNIKLKPMNAPQDRNKAQFILGLQSFFSSGDVVFVGSRQDHSQLASQVLNFPSGKKDIINALAYVNRVFTGDAIYSDFSDANIFEQYTLNRNSKLLLLCNSDSLVTTAILCAVDGEYITILSDWVSPLIPSEFIPGVVSSIRVSYPKNSITAWVPADVFDQITRSPLIASLKAEKITPNRSEYSYVSRGSLSNLIRTTVRGRRLLMVERNSKDVLHALAMGYNFPSKSTGETVREPERNASKTLMEALECLTQSIRKNNQSDDYSANSVNSSGTPYRSALKRS